MIDGCWVLGAENLVIFMDIFLYCYIVILLYGYMVIYG